MNKRKWMRVIAGVALLVSVSQADNLENGGFDDFSAMAASAPLDCDEAIALGYGLREDANGDCYVDLADMVKFGQDWLRCVSADPNDLESDCETPWIPVYPPTGLEYLAASVGTTGGVWSDDFESGDFSNWTPGWSGTPGWIATSLNGGVLTPHSGTYMATCGVDPGPTGFFGTMCRHTFTTPLVGYTLTAYMALTGELPSYEYFPPYIPNWDDAVAVIGITPSSGHHISVRIKLNIVDPNNPTPRYGIVHNCLEATYDPWGPSEYPEGTQITVVPGEWIRVDLYGGPEGMIIVVDGRHIVRSPYTGLGWDAGNNLKSVWFGSGWGSIPAGYDDFIVTPGLPDAIPVNCEVAMERSYGLASDFNEDCEVNALDFATFAEKWLVCVEPTDGNCLAPWE